MDTSELNEFKKMIQETSNETLVDLGIEHAQKTKDDTNYFKVIREEILKRLEDSDRERG